MVRLYFDKEQNDWVQIERNENSPNEEPIVYLDGKLKKQLDKVKKRQASDNDATILICGPEGSGKSTLALVVSYYLSNGQLTLDNVCVGSDDTKNKIHKIKKGVIMNDEGSLDLSSTDVMTKKQKDLTKILNVCRQLNNILVIVAPSFFRLASYIAIERSLFLLNVYQNKAERGYFSYYGTKKKNLVYYLGKQQHLLSGAYKKVKPKFRGRFTKFNPFGDAYIKLKEDTLKSLFEQDKKITKKSILKELVKKKKDECPELTHKELGNLYGVNERTIFRYLHE